MLSAKQHRITLYYMKITSVNLHLLETIFFLFAIMHFLQIPLTGTVLSWLGSGWMHIYRRRFLSHVPFPLADVLLLPGCECHGHADSCHFSQWLWQSTGGASGGVCDGCRHNTEGSRCQRCRPGYRRRGGRPLSSPHACTRKGMTGGSSVTPLKSWKTPNGPPAHYP